MYTGPDGDAVVQNIEMASDVLMRAESIQFRETAAHSSRDLHTAPSAQLFLMLGGIVKFTVRNGSG
jgi:hypothetical protein